MRNPFSVGRWVSGSQFFGRQNLMRTLMDSEDSCSWVIGKRRMGKTSLLREMERRLNQDTKDQFGLFWDIQGSYDADGLFDSLYDAIEDNQDLYEERWEKIDFDLEEHKDTFQLLKYLARSAGRAGFKLYLLIDECEELINVGKSHPALLSKLRRLFQNNRHLRTIMASSPTLSNLGKDLSMDTSPFLHGFSVSYLGNLRQEDCLSMLGLGIQDRAIANRIYDLTDGNPFEAQLVAKHYFDTPDLEAILLDLETNPTLNQTIEVNFRLLEEDERTILKEIHCGTLPFQDFERAIVVKLSRMGYLKESANGHELCSYFQGKWLASHLLDGESSHSETYPGEVLEGIVITKNQPKELLRQVLEVYKLFLELAQTKQRVQRLADRPQFSERDNTIILDLKTLPLETEKRDQANWMIAIEETGFLIKEMCQNSDSWPVFRFQEMLDSGLEQYTEKDFLDLMMLISEEAKLD